VQRLPASAAGPRLRCRKAEGYLRQPVGSLGVILGSSAPLLTQGYPSTITPILKPWVTMITRAPACLRRAQLIGPDCYRRNGDGPQQARDEIGLTPSANPQPWVTSCPVPLRLTSYKISASRLLRSFGCSCFLIFCSLLSLGLSIQKPCISRRPPLVGKIPISDTTH
jgi:hypothetical protein